MDLSVYIDLSLSGINSYGLLSPCTMASLYIVSPLEANAVGIVCVYLSESSASV
jgi:hypothetical protein